MPEDYEDEDLLTRRERITVLIDLVADEYATAEGTPPGSEAYDYANGFVDAMLIAARAPDIAGVIANYVREGEMHAGADWERIDQLIDDFREAIGEEDLPG